MSLFSAIKRIIKTEQPLLGLTDAVCPYCEASLQKKPGRKKKCPHCSNFIYVRTRPQDKAKVLLREDQLLAMEEQWSIANGTHEHFVAQQSRLKSVTDQLRTRFGREPSANDVQWSMLNDDVLTHMQNKDWGLYRNSRFAMAEILTKEKKHLDCLNFLLEVCFLDLNGPNNCGGITDPFILREYPPFDPKIGSLAPGVISRVLDAMDSSGISLQQAESRFNDVAHRLSEVLRLPLSADKAWRKLKRELKAT
jgi:hypothetical protein